MPDRPPKSEQAARLAREAAALRGNLAKRKAQARERGKAPRVAAPRPVCPQPAPDKV